jgi:hypothetical protein
VLTPLLSIAHRPVAAPSETRGSEPRRAGTRLGNLRWARDTGRLRDLANWPFMVQLPFERRQQRSRSWWNGLLYSWYQLLVLPEIDDLLVLRRYHRRGAHRIAWLPEPHPQLLPPLEDYIRARLGHAARKLETNPQKLATKVRCRADPYRGASARIRCCHRRSGRPRACG